MSEKDDLLIYDEDDSVKFIQNYLPQELKDKFSNDDINYIVDLVYEFYESKGFLNEDPEKDTEVEIDEEELVAFVIKNANKDGVGRFEAEEIQFLVQGELEYCDSINMFD
jgi:DNA-directed RNA polymerase specialized sigma54-like protein